MPGVAERNALVFVQIPTHFREMIRVAELLQDAPGFRPVVLFMTNYAGVQEDIRRCTDRGIRVIAADDLYTYLPRRPAPRRFAALDAIAAGARRMASAGRLARERVAVAMGKAAAFAALPRMGIAATARRAVAGVNLVAERARGGVASAWRLAASWLSPVRARVAGGAEALARGMWALMLWCVEIVAVALSVVLPQGVRDRLRPFRSFLGRAIRARATAFWVQAVAPRKVGFAFAAAPGRRLRAAITAAWIVASTRRTLAFSPGAALSRAARTLSRTLGSAFAALRGIPPRVGRRLAMWAAPHIRRVLMCRVPSVADAQWLQRLPSPVRLSIVVLAGTIAKALWILAIPLLPLIRRLFTAAFAIAYRRAPDSLPPDIRAQHYVWRMVPRLLEENEIELVLLPEDNFYYFTNLFVKEIHARGGKAVIVPFTIVNVLEWAEAFKSLPSHDAEILMNRVVAMLFPQWCYRHKGKWMVMPPQQVLSNEALGVAPPIPWLINSGRADAIAAESLFMADYYRKAGIPEEKIRFTGALADDVLHRMLVEADSRRESLYRQLALAPDRPMILCALPPNQLAGDGRPQCAFSDYLELLAAFVEPLERLADDYNIVVSLHPRITAPQARVLEGRRLRVSRESVAELVPLSRIYVASCSATIRLAISCGIPVVNYDVFVYDYDDFKKVPGVVTVDRQDNYVAALEGLARAPEHYRHLRDLQLEFAREQTVLDGKAGQRMLELFEQLMNPRTVA